MAKIVIIDDDADVLVVSKIALEGAGHDVTTVHVTKDIPANHLDRCKLTVVPEAFTTAPYAFPKQLEIKISKADIIITDYDMKHVTGLGVAKKIRQMAGAKHTPIILHTSVPEQITVSKSNTTTARKLGIPADRIIDKANCDLPARVEAILQEQAKSLG